MADIVVIVQPETAVPPLEKDRKTILVVANEVVGIFTLITDPAGSILAFWTVTV